MTISPECISLTKAKAWNSTFKNIEKFGICGLARLLEDRRIKKVHISDHSLAALAERHLGVILKSENEENAADESSVLCACES